MRPGALVLALALVAPGCAGTHGDRTGAVRFDHARYDAVGLAPDPAAYPSRLLATGVDIIDCGSASQARSVDRVTAYAIAGVDADLAVAVYDDEWSGLYVREGVARRDWPGRLREQARAARP